MIGIVLAGGRATRLGGGDKGLRTVGGRPILQRVVSALQVQCDSLIINAAVEDAVGLGGYGILVPDAVVGQPGPLAGVLAGLDHIAVHHPHAAFAVSVPNDTPFLPRDLVARLQDKRVADRASIVCARSDDTTHNVVALWSVSLREDLRRALVVDGVRKVRDYLARHAVAYVTWPTKPFDPFFNVNTPEDLAAAERIAATMEAGGASVE